MNLADLVLLTLKISIVLTVFTLGLEATVRDATSLFRRPAVLARTTIAMNVVMPIIAIVLALSFDLHPAVKIGLVALAVSPVPPILPRKALRAGGHEDYVIGLLVAASLLAILTVPIAMAICERAFQIPLQSSASTVASLVLTRVLVPLGLGMLVRRLAPALAERASEPLRKIAAILLVASALPIVLKLGQPMMSLVGDGTLAALAAFAAVGVIVGHLLGGPAEDDRSVLALATATRHPGVAIALAQRNFPEQTQAIAAIALGLIVVTVVTGFYIAWHKRHALATSVGPRRA